MQISYTFSGEWKEYNELLRRFKLSELLKCIDALSQRLLNQDPSKVGYGIWKTVLVPITSNSSVQKQDIYVMAWRLVDIAYHAIISSNDYRGTECISDDAIKLICAAENNYQEEQEKNVVEKIKETVSMLHYVWGFAGEQFKFQEAGRTFENAGRELYMLFELAKSIEFPCVSEIVLEETGVTWQVLIASLFLTWFGCNQGLTISRIRSMTTWNEEFCEEDYKTVINRYTTNYTEVRNTTLKRQIFYTKPYIETQTHEQISINGFLNLFIYEHAVLWTIRDYYNNKNSRQFTADFGKLFEEYFLELLSMYLPNDSYQRIPESPKERRADWLINLCGYRLIIEQKSTIMRLAVKQQNSDYDAMAEFLKGNVIKALGQLKATEDMYGDGEYIKVVLLYDDYLSDNVLSSVFMMEECDIEDDRRYWLVGIDEMEMLLHLYRTNPNKCKKVLNEKDYRCHLPIGEGRSIRQLLEAHGITSNEHIKQEKYQYYTSFAEHYIRKLLPQVYQLFTVVINQRY